MKKLFIFAAILLFGVGSVFAQDAWEVRVEWTYDANSTCDDQLSSEYGFAAAMTVHDAANNETVINNATLSSSDYTIDYFDFDASAVQAYCNSTPPPTNTPSFNIYVTVKIVHLSTHSELCSVSDTFSPYSCSDFSNGITVYPEFE